LEKLSIAMAASQGLRSGPDSPFIRIIRDFTDFFSQHKLYASQGTYNAIQRCGLLLTHDNLTELSPGTKGAVVEIVALVASKEVDAVIFLSDPRHSLSVFPEVDALKRMSVANERLFFSTTRSVYEWITLTWLENRAELVQADRLRNLGIARSISKQTIALIAHDPRKEEMIRFAAEHQSFLNKFERIIATGTTGSLLSGKLPDRGDRNDEEWAGILKCRELVNEFDLKLPRVDRQYSGPRGGDVTIANEVLKGECNKVIFFEDPYAPHPHLADIKLLERTCCIKGKHVVAMSDPTSAKAWAKSWQLDKGGFHEMAPETLSQVLSELFGVKAILVDTHETDSEVTMQRISVQAAWYLYSWVYYRARNRSATFNRIICAFPWGKTMASVLTELEQILKDPRQKSPCVVPEFTAVPTSGIIGHTNPTYESNSNAKRAAHSFGGAVESISATAYIQKGSAVDDDVDAPVAQLYKQCELAFLVAAPLSIRQDGFGGAFSSSFISRHLVDDVKGRGAIGETNGVFLDNDGRPMESSRFKSIGMKWTEVADIRKRPGGRVVLLIGNRLEYIPIALACLKSKVVTTIIADRRFAHALLKKVEEDPASNKEHRIGVEAVAP
jgi:methylglyoxal synthase